MALARPTLKALIDRALGDINARMPGADSRLRRSALEVVGRMHAGAAHGLYGFIEAQARELLPDTAVAALERHASIWGVTRKPAVASSGTAVFTGANGAHVPNGRLLQRGDGVEYQTDQAGDIAGGTLTLRVEAVAPGVAADADAGVALNFVSPVAGVNAQAIVAAPGLAGGLDQEGDAQLRARLLARIRDQPAGGSRADYVRWALEVPGVTRAWCYPEQLGAGTVGLAFVRDADADIFPGAGEIADVAAHLELYRPVTAELTVFAPTPVEVDLTIELTPSSAPVRAAVAAELADLLVREAEPGGTLLLSHLNEAISAAAGETDHVLTTPAADVECDPGELAVLGEITWS